MRTIQKQRDTVIALPYYEIAFAREGVGVGGHVMQVLHARASHCRSEIPIARDELSVSPALALEYIL